MYTVELNLDADYSFTTSYHVCEEFETISRHFDAALTGRKLDRWVYIGSGKTFKEALEFAQGFRERLCEKSGKSAKNMQDQYDEWTDKIMKENQKPKENT